MMLQEMTYESFIERLSTDLNLSRETTERVSRKEAASILGVSIAMIDKITRSGKLKKYKIGSRSVFEKDQVLSLLQ